MTSPQSQPKRIRLVAWAVQEAGSSSKLPVLDPDGLYVTSIFQARRGAKVALGDTEIEIQGPSSFLHSKLPCLEDASTGVMLADSIPLLEAYSWKLAGKKAERSLLEEDDRKLMENPRQSFKNKALEQYIMTNLHPLIHQILFAKDLFDSHTSRVYQSGLGSIARYSLPNRLRRQLQMMYAERGRNIDLSNGLGQILLEQNTQKHLIMEDRKEREQLAQRAGIGISGGAPSAVSLNKKQTGSGLFGEEKEKANQAFIQLRTLSFAEKIFVTLTDFLGSNEFFTGTQKPSKLDLRIFSLLAPLLLSEEVYPSLAKSAIVQSLKQSYPTLVQHSDRIRLLLWPFDVSSQTHQIQTPDWPILPGNITKIGQTNDEPLSIRIATQLGRSTSQAFIFAKRMASNIRPSSQSTTSTSNEKEKANNNSSQKPMTSSEKHEARMITLGKYVWIASLIIGTIGTAFASGLLAIQFVDEDQIEAEEEVEEKIILETEEGEDVEIDVDDLAETVIDEEEDEDEEEEEDDDDEWDEEMMEEENLFDDEE